MSAATEAAKRLAVRQKGGIRGMAAQMAVNENGLYHKLDPSRPELLTLEEAEQMTALSGDAEIAKALAQLSGHICVPVGLVGGVDDDALFAAFTSLCAKLGDVASTFNQAAADHQINRNEERALDEKIEHLIQAGAELRRRMHAKAASDAAAAAAPKLRRA